MKNGFRRALPLILVAYAVLGALYALYTPSWQVPDEPAHYNYIRTLAEQGLLPVMGDGDYDEQYLQRLRDQRFPADLSIEPLTYEDHQPPLYYLVAAPFYLLFDGGLVPLRLVSVLLGLFVLVIAYGVVNALFPGRPFLALAATILIAFLPQHVAMTAGVNNDVMAEVVLGLALWTAIQYLDARDGETRSVAIRLGLIVGLGFLTKTAAYVALPAALLAVALRARRTEGGLREAVIETGWMLLATFLLAGPYLIRNISVYGWSDPLGLGRHNAVVVGQLRTGEALNQYGWRWLIERFARFTFQSFWGQFGWMGVPLQPAIYAALGLLSALLGAGFVGWLANRRARLASQQRDGLLLLGTSALLTVLSYLWYNLTFVQHQGRYLFPALIPLALGAALGLNWLLEARIARWATVALAGVALFVVGAGLVRGDMPVIPVTAAFGLAAALSGPWILPRWGRWLFLVGLAAGLVVLNLHALFQAIVPALAMWAEVAGAFVV